MVNLKEIDSAKRTYNNVDYFLNFHDAMYSAEYFADFVRVMHLLICEKIGVDNFDTINLKKSVEDFLFKKLGMHCIAFEHGTTNSYSTGANSVDHVHLHILPFSRPVWNEIITNIPATTVNTVESYNDLFEVWKKNIPDTYLLFQDLDQKLYYISDSSYMPSQLFRKCLAPYLGANYWDWRSESYSNNILETISLFKGIIE